MLRAVASDFAAVADVTTLLTMDFPALAGCRCERTTIPDSRSRLERLIAEHDAVLPIAPESGGLLASLAECVVTRNRILLGCSPDAVRLTADKLALAKHWSSQGVTTPATRLASEANVEFPSVLKPRDGAGSQATRLLSNPNDWRRSVDNAVAECPDAEFVVQPYHPGRACSQAFLMGSRQIIPLRPARQRLSEDGSFRYLGGTLPLDAESAERALRIAEGAVAGIGGLAGFVGVDLVLGDDGRDVAIEINPRVTTSYVGLRALCRGNLAEAWLRLASGADDVELKWDAGRVRFDAEGAVEVLRKHPGCF